MNGSRIAALLAGVILPLGTVVAQQPARVSGTVIDRATGQGIASAEVRLGDDDRTTAASGRFVFDAVRPGTLELRIQAIGYGGQALHLEIVGGEDRTITMALAAAPVSLEPIEVAAPRQLTIDGNTLVNRGPDLATALDGWAGIAVTRTGAGNAAVPQIRGSAPEEVLVLMDGFMLNDPLTGRADLSRIATRDIDRLSLERGAQSARYGNRGIAGVISIDTRRPPAPEIFADLGSFGSVTARAGMSGGPVSGSITVDRLAHRYEYKMPSGRTAQRQNAGGEVYNLSAQVAGPVRITVRGSLSERGLPGTTVNPTPAARSSDRTLFLGARSGRTDIMTASLSWLESRVVDSAPPPGFPAYDSRTQGWGATLALAALRKMRVGQWSGGYSVGLETRYDRFSGDAVQSGADFARSGVAASANLSRSRGPGTWTLAPAARLDWWSGESSPRPSGRLDLHWARKGTVLSGGMGNGVTAPALADLLFREGVGVAVNPGLRPERVRWEVEAGIRQAVNLPGLSGAVELSGFDGRIADMILWSATGGALQVWRPDNFDVRRKGFEVSVDLQPGSTFTFTGTMTLSDVRYDSPGGAQVRYRPRATQAVYASWAPGRWRTTLRWNRLGTRFTTTRGTNPLAPINLVSASIERAIGPTLTLRAEVRDLLDSRATYVAGYPSAGRTFHLSGTLDFP